MLDAIHAAHHALNQTQQQLDITAENIANVNTPAYKEAIYQGNVTYDDSRIDKITTHSQAREAKEAQRPQITYDFAQGHAIYTARPLDIMLKGDGLLHVSWHDQSYYTRLGKLHIGNDGNLYLDNGARLLGLNGAIPNDVEKLTIDHNGIIWADNRKIGQLDLVQITHPQNLRYVAQGMYQLTQGATSQIIQENQNNQNSQDSQKNKVEVLQGYLESSNVNNVDTMMNMMKISQDFSASQKVVQTYDDMLGNAINDM
ncbi:flagellar hook basal-body protein [Cysteiniphilum sp. QT6929]|uniref:flagellar hook-basal body protein n=1 Tax=Cysteiniphilum sp. QT6929 TaxID=2975055 RepID=UPI0024B37D59|nr:flagellar hook basal-body protein [Cysteiniphilum sp. QT6929]WHN66088.1 flagellar hook basal-body protein [Cysteiniphilum sp. QT6929]